MIRCTFDSARLQLTVSLKLYGNCYLVATILVDVNKYDTDVFCKIMGFHIFSCKFSSVHRVFHWCTEPSNFSGFKHFNWPLFKNFPIYPFFHRA